MLKQKRKSGSQQVGCSFFLWTGIGLLTLFLINNMIIRILFSANLQNTDERVMQAAQFLLPIGMLLVEYWFLDWLKESIGNLRSRNTGD